MFWPKSPIASRLTPGSRTEALRVFSRRRFLSVSHLCRSQSGFQENHSISSRNRSGERTKESFAIVTLALYNLQVSMRCDITNKRPQTKKKKYCHLGILLSPVKRSICDAEEPMHEGNVIKMAAYTIILYSE